LKNVAISLLSILLISCHAHSPKNEADPKVGLDASGSLVMHVFGSGSQNARPVVLRTDYGVMMHRGIDGCGRFILATKASSMVREFTNYDEFIETMSELPKGSVIDIYDRCTVPVFYDFYPVHHELLVKFENDCHKHGLTITAQPIVTCDCATEWR
jgi:hypothetical protein